MKFTDRKGHFKLFLKETIHSLFSMAASCASIDVNLLCTRCDDLFVKVLDQYMMVSISWGILETKKNQKRAALWQLVDTNKRLSMSDMINDQSNGKKSSNFHLLPEIFQPVKFSGIPFHEKRFAGLIQSLSSK